MGTLLYSNIYAYNAERMTGEKPTTLEDFFDLERFPGRRGPNPRRCSRTARW